MTCDMVFTKYRKPLNIATFSRKYYNTLHNKCKTKLYKKGFGKIFIFVKYDPMPTLSDMRVGNNFKKFLFYKKNIVISDFCMYNASTINY